MNGPFLTFMLVPCAGGIFAGRVSRHWSLAAATLFGALALSMAVITFDPPYSMLILPFGTGCAAASVVLIAMLTWRPSVSVWTRMSAGLGTAFLTHFYFLSLALAG